MVFHFQSILEPILSMLTPDLEKFLIEYGASNQSEICNKAVLFKCVALISSAFEVEIS